MRTRRDPPAAANGVVNVASVPHRSPFRYPGGKTWLVPRVRQWLASRPRPAVLIEPFAGGAIVGLSAALDGLVDGTLLVELDEGVAAVWEAVTAGLAGELAERIGTFAVTEANVRAALAARPAALVDRAFQTILRNRTQRGGILAPGASLMKRGENDRGLASRWYAGTLQRRLLDLGALGDRLRFVRGDGLVVLAEQAEREDAVWFLDPPYTVAGRRLYAHNALDHRELFRRAADLRGDFLMTYDDSAFIRALAAEFGFATRAVAMKNTHHAVMSELLVGRNLDWVRSATV